MKLVMTLLVRDEADILRENLLYHLSQGVDYFVVTDNLSVDATRDILREFEAQGLVHLIEETQDTYAQFKWVTRMARMAAASFGADWVINSDADEFWWPRRGTLKSTFQDIPDEYSVVTVPRHNFVLSDDRILQGPATMTVRHAHSRNALGQPLPPKVCHRGLPDVDVSQGNHSVSSSHALRAFPGQPMEILHFPIRSFAQLENKISKGGSAQERNRMLDQVGGTWRKLYQDLQQGRLMDYFRTEVFTEEDIRQGVKTGELVEDDRLRDFMRSRRIIQ